ncbi:hypothetical protein MMC24_001722 [Lignoscripta atroalba]|nr:hypothetical protein [Lignoscripta atroalba]
MVASNRVRTLHDHRSSYFIPGFGDLFDSKYDFRPSARAYPKGVSAWVDQDKSGDFDPDAKEPQHKITSCRKRERTICDGENSQETGPKKPKVNTWQLGRKLGQSCRITIRIASARGICLLRKLRDYSDNWPEQQFVSDDSEPNFTELTLASVQPARLRKRRFDLQAHTSSGLLCDTLLPFTEVTLGHPAARGCRACLELGLTCPLLHEGSTYPCTDCVEADIDCELVLPPAKKRPCESCRSRRIVCSYRDVDDHNGPCKQCSTTDIKCVAGPLSGRTRTGPCLDQNFSKPARPARFLPTPQRRFISCTECRMVKKSCSLRWKSSDGNCTRCEGLGESCTFEPLAQKQKPIPETQSDQPAEPSKLTMSERNNEISLTKVIKTRLAHPVSFNHQVREDGSDPCHWCDDIAYGILGLGEIKTEVINYRDGQGYVELESGHTRRGREPSRMCHECTFQRMLITACLSHDIHPIEGVDPDEFDNDTALDWLSPGMANSAPFEWCSVCPNPASFACRTSRGANLMDENENDICQEEEGCGLKLCEACCVCLVEEHSKNLGGLVAALESDEDTGPFGVRADAGFLRTDGEIMRRLYGG